VSSTVNPTGAADSAVARQTAAAIERLRRTPWYRDARWTRLLGMAVMGYVLAVMTGDDGDPADRLSAFKAAFHSTRLPVCVLITVGLWALLEFGGPVRAAADAGWKRALAPLAPVRTAFAANRWARLGGLAVALAAAIVVPALVNAYWQEVLVSQMGVFMLLAVGLNVVVGWAGLLDLGFIAFYAIGAYSATYWTGHLPVAPPFVLNPFLAIPFSVAICLVAGLLLGAPTLRLRGDYLAIVTLGFHEIVYLVAKNADGFTGGARGALGTPHFSVHLGPVDYDWTLDPLPYWYLILAFLVILVTVFGRLEHSRIGRIWTAIREDEVAAASCGVNTVRYKLLAFAIGASTSGLAGVVYASKIGYINPENFPLVMSVLVLAYVIFGGMGSIPGVLAGAAILVWLPNVLRDYVKDTDRYMYLGALLVIMMIYRPQGVIPSKRRQRELHLAEQGVGDADAVSEPAGGGAA
jgi:branched-chain amino acid transport system permease protein